MWFFGPKEPEKSDLEKAGEQTGEAVADAAVLAVASALVPPPVAATIANVAKPFAEEIGRKVGAFVGDALDDAIPDEPEKKEDLVTKNAGILVAAALGATAGSVITASRKREVTIPKTNGIATGAIVAASTVAYFFFVRKLISK